jgi:hypothetical protein
LTAVICQKTASVFSGQTAGFENCTHTRHFSTVKSSLPSYGVYLVRGKMAASEFVMGVEDRAASYSLF